MSDTTTALAFVFPENHELHHEINEVRKKHDKAYKRWMPHIIFFFPFVSPTEFNDVKTNLETLNFEPFEVEFNDVGFFSQTDYATVHLRPTAESSQKMIDMHEKMLTKLGLTKKREFAPHLTMGQFSKTEAKEWRNLLREQLVNNPIKVSCTAIMFLHRNEETNDQMKVFDRLQLVD